MRKRTIAKTTALHTRAQTLIPNGVNLLSRKPCRYADGVAPSAFERAKGALAWDLDGNEYIDCNMSVGAVVLGHCDPDVDAAVHRQIDIGTAFSLLNPVEVQLAELIVDVIPCAEMVRLGRSGGEADAVAVRIARGFTGRDKVAFCGYHGWHDWYLAANLESRDALNQHLLPGVPCTGVPKALAGTALPFKYNDIDSLRETLERNRGEVACVVMEASRFDFPKEGYLERVKELTHEHGALLIFDEIVTGFRMALGGAQEYFGVIPDMATFGKCIANGYPLTAVAGRKDVMDASADMFISSSFWDDACMAAAGVAAITKMRREHVQNHLARVGGRFKKEIGRIAEKAGLHMRVKSHESQPLLVFEYDDAQLLKKVETLFSQELAVRGVFGNNVFKMSYAHDDRVIDRILEAAEGAMAVIKKALDSGNMDSCLKAAVQTPVFQRRMV